MPKDTELDMQEEYSFAGGVRGRYAARFTPREREELVRRSALHEVQLWIARALLQIQSLEATPVTYVALAWGESPEDASQKVTTLFDRSGTPTLRRLFEDASEFGLSAEAIQARFRQVTQERNWLVHRGSIQTQAVATQVADLLPFIRRLEQLSAEARSVELELNRMLETHLARTGLSQQEIELRAADVRSQWLAA